MTFDEALLYLINYGNLHGTVEECKKAWSQATCGQLRNAALYAINVMHRPKEEVDQALIALIWRQP